MFDKCERKLVCFILVVECIVRGEIVSQNLLKIMTTFNPISPIGCAQATGDLLLASNPWPYCVECGCALRYIRMIRMPMYTDSLESRVSNTEHQINTLSPLLRDNYFIFKGEFLSPLILRESSGTCDRTFVIHVGLKLSFKFIDPNKFTKKKSCVVRNGKV